MHIVAPGAFDDLRSRDVRFLEECSRLGNVTVILWDDESVEECTGAPPKFPLSEREYLLKALRFVSRVTPVDGGRIGTLAAIRSLRPQIWADYGGISKGEAESLRRELGIQYRSFEPEQLCDFQASGTVTASGRKKVVATGCYDWLHSGHVRFFEEISAYGDVYAIVGHDANIRLLKGDGHPLHPQEERRYMVGAIRYVFQALISTGDGWLDAEPEIDRLKPDIYAVNEDGDRGGKREFCAQRGIQYLVLKRVPAPGLPRRSSTDLRGF